MHKRSNLIFKTICSLAAVSTFTSNGYSQPLGLTPITPPNTEPKPGTRGGCLIIPFAPYTITKSNNLIIVKTTLSNPKLWIYVRLTGDPKKEGLTISKELSISFAAPDGKSVARDKKNVVAQYLPNEKVYESGIKSFTLPIKHPKHQNNLEIGQNYRININCGSLGDARTVVIQRIANTETVSKSLSTIDRITKFAGSNLWLETVDTLIDSYSKCESSETIVGWLEQLANNKLLVRDESTTIMKTLRKQFRNNCSSVKGK